MLTRYILCQFRIVGAPLLSSNTFESIGIRFQISGEMMGKDNFDLVPISFVSKKSILKARSVRTSSDLQRDVQVVFLTDSQFEFCKFNSTCGSVYVP